MVSSNLLPNAVPGMHKGAAALHLCCSLLFGTKGPEDTLPTRTAGISVSLGLWGAGIVHPHHPWEVQTAGKTCNPE